MRARRPLALLSAALVTAGAVAGVGWWRRPPRLDLDDVGAQLGLIRPVAPLSFDAAWAQQASFGDRVGDVAGLRVGVSGAHRSRSGMVAAAWSVAVAEGDRAALERGCSALTDTAGATSAALQGRAAVDTAALRRACLEAPCPADYVIPQTLGEGSSPTRTLAHDVVAVTRWQAGVVRADESSRRLLLTVTVIQLEAHPPRGGAPGTADTRTTTGS
ncbi:MAG: hypothetical protein U0Q15_16670 [Kineosporiaceae bacterium]